MAQPIINPFHAKLKEQEFKKELLQKKLEKEFERTKQLLQTQLQIGTDSRVDEAIMFTFLASLAESIGQGIKEIYKKIQHDKEKKINQEQLSYLEQQVEKLAQASENFDLTMQTADKLNKYQLLHAKSSLIAQALDKNKFTEAEKPLKEKELTKIKQEMNEIAKFCNEKNIASLETTLTKSEEKVLGEENAQMLKDFREQTGDVKAIMRGTMTENELNNGEIPDNIVKQVQSAVVNNIYNGIIKEATMQEKTTQRETI